MKNQILIVENESLVAMEISSALEKENYVVTEIVDNAEDAFKSIEENIPDLVMMDINIDGETDGIEASHIIEYDYKIPIIFLTAYSDSHTINKAIESSPSAYLIKPFKRQELYAAVSLAISKSLKRKPEFIELYDGCVYKPDASELEMSTQTISLTKKEKQLLDLLLEHKGNVVAFETIELELWPDKEVSVTTRRTLIHRLREKLGRALIGTKKDIGCSLKKQNDIETLSVTSTT